MADLMALMENLFFAVSYDIDLDWETLVVTEDEEDELELRRSDYDNVMEKISRSDYSNVIPMEEGE